MNRLTGVVHPPGAVSCGAQTAPRWAAIVGPGVEVQGGEEQHAAPEGRLECAHPIPDRSVGMQRRTPDMGSDGTSVLCQLTLPLAQASLARHGTALRDSPLGACAKVGGCNLTMPSDLAVAE